ncbi:MAG: hypothetical protein M3483_00545 [Gemmatimonadota bacterium]|nr:hypothetical protein [Gemmatimonadota bacterium]
MLPRPRLERAECRQPPLRAIYQGCREQGGQVLNGPMEVPGGGWIAQCLDPQGSAFAVHQEA